MRDKEVLTQATDTLVQLIVQTTWDDIPAGIQHEAKRSLLNYFAVALGGFSDLTIEIAARVMGRFSAGDVTVVGRSDRFDALSAASLNAMSANVFDFDDTHIPTILHPTAPVAPVVSALSQVMPVSGKDFLLAFILGVEIECRLANAVSPGHYSRGWHITSTCGIFGAAAAASRLLLLTPKQTAWALGSAASQSCGLVEALGSSAKSAGLGAAARGGLLAALLAAEGFDGPRSPIEGERGFLKVFADGARLDEIVQPAQAWQLASNTYKPYPCGVVLNPVIDACLRMARNPELATRLESVSRITVTGHPLLRQRTDRPAVPSGRASQVSAQHAIAVSLLRGKAGLEEFSDEATRQPDIQALGARVVFEDDPGFSVEGAKLEVVLADGTMFNETVERAHGSLSSPMTDREIEDKLRSLCAYGRSGVDAEPLIEAIWRLDSISDAASVLALASPPQP